MAQYFEDHESQTIGIAPTNWTHFPGNTFEIEAGFGGKVMNITPGGGWGIARHDSFTFSDGLIQARHAISFASIMFIRGTAFGTGGGTNPSNFPATGYNMQIATVSSVVAIQRTDPTSSTTLTVTALPGGFNKLDHILEFSAVGSVLTVKLNGAQVLQTTDTTYAGPGNIGFGQFSTAGELDDITICDLLGGGAELLDIRRRR